MTALIRGSLRGRAGPATSRPGRSAVRVACRVVPVRLALLSTTGRAGFDRLQGLRRDERAGCDLLRHLRLVPRVERRDRPARRLDAAPGRRRRAAAGPDRALGSAHRGRVDRRHDRDRHARRARLRTRRRRARSSVPTAARPTTRPASTARAAPPSSPRSPRRPTRSSPPRPTSRSIPPVAIAGVIGAVALLAILAFVPAAQGIAGAVVRGRGHRGAVRLRREQPALDRGELVASGVRVGRGRVRLAERRGVRRRPRSRRAGSRSRPARTATPT